MTHNSCTNHAAAHFPPGPDGYLLRDESVFAAYRPYVQHLWDIALQRDTLAPGDWRRLVGACLDGEPATELRQRASAEHIRTRSAFFTGRRLARKALAHTIAESRPGAIFFDPACGAGDLLLEVARSLPVTTSIEGTLNLWGERLAGCDLVPEFVQATRARLLLLAMDRTDGGRYPRSLAGHREWLPMVTCADGLSEGSPYSEADCIVVNPPFSLMKILPDCEWATGTANTAAVFVERVLRLAKPFSRITAILPDVLRSGSRYHRWRDVIHGLAHVLSVRSHGVFSKWADVDVFVLDMMKQESPSARRLEARPRKTSPSTGTVGRYFAVHVGTVVPHRHAETGPLTRFIHSRLLPRGGYHEECVERRRFSGTTFLPPFVAVRRTSNPKDGQRAVACVVVGAEPVAVENHLLVLLPRDRSARSCENLRVRLKSAKTDEWLNRRIRCRHLTVRALADLPWWSEGE